jgi:hypothetical protein
MSELGEISRPIVKQTAPSKSLPKRLSRRPRETVSWKRICAKRMVSKSPVASDQENDHKQVHAKDLLSYSTLDACSEPRSASGSDA